MTPGPSWLNPRAAAYRDEADFHRLVNEAIGAAAEVVVVREAAGRLSRGDGRRPAAEQRLAEAEARAVSLAEAARTWVPWIAGTSAETLSCRGPG